GGRPRRRAAAVSVRRRAVLYDVRVQRVDLVTRLRRAGGGHGCLGDGAQHRQPRRDGGRPGLRHAVARHAEPAGEAAETVREDPVESRREPAAPIPHWRGRGDPPVYRPRRLAHAGGAMTHRARTAGLFLFLLNTAYLAAYASPTAFYFTNVALHIGIGAALAVWYGRDVRAAWRRTPLWARLSSLVLAAGVAFGLVIVVIGAYGPYRWLLPVHIALSIAGGLPLLLGAAMVQLRLAEPQRRLAAAIAILVVAAAGTASAIAIGARPARREAAYRIANPKIPPMVMDEEGAGPSSPFFPSAADTNVHRTIPSTFFMTSESCGRCHRDIYDQWKSSMHHFSSFNNQWYRKSIEYMQDTIVTQPSKWCAGCHDHAVFFNGRFEKPIKEQIDTAEAQAGLACTSCHAITRVRSTMGQGDFEIEYPPLHELANSKNPFIRQVDRFLTYTDPEPHRKTFMKPFMRMDSSEFCSTCHKVHLDVPVNSYRWFRGFNDYDNWQASAVSGQGARSFYYPAETKTCAACHMPKVDSQDPGNVDGKVHSHRFPAANMALAHVNQDEKQKEVIEKFLTSGFITVDILSVSPVEQTSETQMVRRRAAPDTPQLMST